MHIYQTLQSILAGKNVFATSDQGDSFTMGIHVGNHFMKLPDFCGLYGGQSPVDGNKQPLITDQSQYPLVALVDAEGQVRPMSTHFLSIFDIF